MAQRQLMVMKKANKVLPIPNILSLMTRQRQMTGWPAGIVFNIKDEEGNIVETLQFDLHQ
jgi:hypothetical protein